MRFTFRWQPLTALYITFTIVRILVSVPFWTLLSIPSSFRPRKAWSIGRCLIMKLMQVGLVTVYSVGFQGTLRELEQAEKTASETGFVWLPRPSNLELIQGEIKDMASRNNVSIAERVGGYWYGERGGDESVGQAAGLGEKVMYFLHGGGYVMQSASPKASSGPVIQNLLERKDAPFSRCFGVEYRLASASPWVVKNAYPAPLIDAIIGYDYLVNVLGFQTQNIVVAGDSAGGHLALQLARYLSQTPVPYLPPPGRLILISPSGEWVPTHVGPSSSWIKNGPSDFCHPIFTSHYTFDALRGAIPDEEAQHNVWISPGSAKLGNTTGQFNVKSKILVTAGEAEMMLDPLKAAVSRLRSDMGEGAVEYVECANASHDCVVFDWHEPERTETLDVVSKWLAAW